MLDLFLNICPFCATCLNIYFYLNSPRWRNQRNTGGIAHSDWLSAVSLPASRRSDWLVLGSMARSLVATFVVSAMRHPMLEALCLVSGFQAQRTWFV